MARPAFTWLITDTHFNHERMVEFGRPPDYERQLISASRQLFAAQDTVIHLGDVFLYGKESFEEWVAIPSRKVLVRGNHDKKSNGWFERNGFAFVADAIVLGDVIYSHKPLAIFPDGVAYNVHGHFHDNDHRRDESAGWYDPARHFKLAVEDTAYKPVKADEWLQRKKTRQPPEGRYTKHD
jgi:calcineurin-like phosphoesterase family protein